MSRRSTILALAWIGDGRRLISGGEGTTIRFRDASDGSSLKVLRDNDAIIGMAPCPPGNRLAGGGYGGNLHLWDLTEGKPGPAMPEMTSRTWTVALPRSGPW
jgi:WD40 repeat protein